MNNTTIVVVDGRQFEIKNTLTIGEQLALEGQKQALCNGQWGALYNSPDMGDITAALNAQMVAELNIRIVKAPDDWKGADQETDIKKVSKIWKEFADKAGLFPKEEGSGEGKTNSPVEGTGKKDTKYGVSEDMVQKKILASSDKSDVSANDG